MKLLRIPHYILIAVIFLFCLVWSVAADADPSGLRITDRVVHENVLDRIKVDLADQAISLVSNFEVPSGRITLIRRIDLAEAVPHGRLLAGQIDPFELSLSGSLENRSKGDVTVNFYMAPGGDSYDPQERHFVGTVYVPDGQRIELDPSALFQRKLTKSISLSASENESASLFVKVVTRGANESKVVFENLALTRTPVFHEVFSIHNNEDLSIPSHAVVGQVHMMGTIANRGRSEMRVVLVAPVRDAFGMQEYEGYLVDSVVAPKSTARLENLIDQAAQEQLRRLMTEAAFGESVELHLFLFCSEPQKARVDDMTIQTEVLFQ